MKFLVLALCVCAASAASFGQYQPVSRPYATLGNAARVAASPFVAAAKVAASPFVAAAKVASVQEPIVKVAPVQYNPVGSAQSVVVAKTAHSDAEAEVVSNVSQFNPDGSYNSHFETNNGISAESSGTLRTVGDTNYLVVKGSYTYYGADGPVVVTYIADENGFQPRSDSLPVGPPIPKEIAEAIEYTARLNAAAEANKKF